MEGTDGSIRRRPEEIPRTKTPTKMVVPPNEMSTTICGSQVVGMSCCQANGSSPLLVRARSYLKRQIVLNSNEVVAKFTVEKKSSKKQISKNKSGEGACTRKVCSMPAWFESWECEDTYATLAVIGAAASVACAYNCYKQLRF